MEVKIALAGNPNCGKTTMFNDLTGSNQYVGNWPGVTVEKKEGRLKGDRDIFIQDLPGIYSLSPYTLEEVVARNYLINEKPDAIVNIVDGSNIERNLYLTTQLIELGIPTVVAVNMMDIVRKRGDKINTSKLASALGCEIVETSALKGEGSKAAVLKASEMAADRKKPAPPEIYDGCVLDAINFIEGEIKGKADPAFLRWYAVKLFERDDKVMASLKLDEAALKRINERIEACEKELDDDSESIITNARYNYIGGVVGEAVKKKAEKNSMSVSDKIDRIVTNRILGLPIFIVVMALVYAIAMGGWTVSIGTRLTDWANDGLFGDGWYLPFTAKTMEVENDDGEMESVPAFEYLSGEYETAQSIIEAYEAGDSVAYLYDDETGETEELAIDGKMYEEALTVEEPDPHDHGVWVPGIPALFDKILCNSEGEPVVADWLYGLIQDGIVAGVGAVLGFVPQMLVLFLLLSILEDIGYMARVAFVMDRIFRQFGLSGKSFIPMLVATGCGIPGLMASRTIEQDRDRKLTLMTTTFMPCGA
ncbi:MAG: ferrous iron transporter B, partial [Oscillospiraceae bacterium]|nr:ferrous iron transporter B [Oscillospiraceae bacterium]